MGEATGPWGGRCCPKALTKARVREDVSSPHPLLGLGWGPYWALVLVPESSCFHPPPVVALALSLLDKSTQYSWEEGCWETLAHRRPMGEAWRWGQEMEWGTRLHSPGTGHPEGGQGRRLWGRSGPPRVSRDLDWGTGLNRSGSTRAPALGGCRHRYPLGSTPGPGLCLPSWTSSVLPRPVSLSHCPALRRRP